MSTVSTNPQHLFTQITQREHALSRAELKSQGWKPALAASQKRQDAMAGLIASTITPPLACKAGCSYCCHFKVGARAEEVFQIVDYVRTKFSAPRLQRLQEDVARNAATTRPICRARCWTMGNAVSTQCALQVAASSTRPMWQAASSLLTSLRISPFRTRWCRACCTLATRT
jgi:hypothetical protein